MVHSGHDGTFSNLTLMVMQFGQFLDHDLTLTPEMNLCSKECPSKEEVFITRHEIRVVYNPIEMQVNCCDYVGKMETPKSCMPIAVPQSDVFFDAHHPKLKCLDFKRSQPFPCNYSSEDSKTR